MKNKLLIFSVIISSFFGCRPEVIENNSDEIRMIDFYNLNQKVNLTLESFLIKDQKFILLKTEEGNYLRAIDKLSVNDGYIYVLDKLDKSISKFDSLGNFRLKLKKYGEGEGEYLQITDFDIDDSGNFYLIDAQSKKMLKFDDEGAFLQSKRLPFDANLIQLLPNEQILFGLAPWNSMDFAGFQLVVTGLDLNEGRPSLNYGDDIDFNFIYPNRFSKTHKGIFYNRPINNSVFVISENGEMNETIGFDFGKKNVPVEAKKDIESYWEKFKDYAYLVNFVTGNEGYIVGTIRDNRRRDRIFLVDVLEGELMLENLPFSGLEDFPIVGGFFTLADMMEDTLVSFISPERFIENKGSRSLTFPSFVEDHLYSDRYVVVLTSIGSQ